MKILAYLIFCALASSSIAAPFVSPIALQIERDLNVEFDETINEGETQAEVERINGKPNIKCGNIVRSGAKALIFCTATIKTTYDSGGEERNGSATCTSLGYIVKNDKIQGRYNEDAFIKCMESVNDASYD